MREKWIEKSRRVNGGFEPSITWLLIKHVNHYATQASTPYALPFPVLCFALLPTRLTINLTRMNRRAPRVEITQNQFKITFIPRSYLRHIANVSPHATHAVSQIWFSPFETFCSRNGSIALISGAKFERKHGLFVELLSKEQWSDNSIFGTGRVYSMGMAGD